MTVIVNTLKVGQKLVCNTDKASYAGVEKGDVVTVSGFVESQPDIWFTYRVDGKHNHVNWSGRGEFFDDPNVVVTEPVGQAGGLKFDGGKAQWSLLMSTKGMLAAIKGVLAVLTFGAKKYAAHSWREVEDNERRYSDALVRHFVAIQEQGSTAVDEESGLLHIDHLNCNGLFLAELARK
jgi:hypothetical protein